MIMMMMMITLAILNLTHVCARPSVSLLIFRIVPGAIINILILEMKELRLRKINQTSRFLHLVRC